MERSVWSGLSRSWENTEIVQKTVYKWSNGAVMCKQKINLKNL